MKRFRKNIILIILTHIIMENLFPGLILVVGVQIILRMVEQVFVIVPLVLLRSINNYE